MKTISISLRPLRRICKDPVRLIARFYSRSEYDKPFECWTNYFNFVNGNSAHSAIHNSHTFRSHFCLQVILILKTVIRVFTAPLRFMTRRLIYRWYWAENVYSAAYKHNRTTREMPCSGHLLLWWRSTHGLWLPSVILVKNVLTTLFHEVDQSLC